MNPRQASILGYLAAFLALASTPILDALGILALRSGTVLAFVAPFVFASAAVVFGLRVRATGDRQWGTRIVASGIVAFVLGALWGVQAVG